MGKISINEIKALPAKLLEKTRQTSSQTNPFGVSFKGNIISADIFETARTSAKNKLITGAVMSAFSRISEKFESVISFGNRIKQATIGLWNKANDIKIEDYFANAGNYVKSKIELLGDPYKVNKLVKRPIGELEQLLKAELG